MRQAKPNYDILFKSAVVKLKIDADVYNELLRKACRFKELHFDDDANLILCEGQLAMAQELQDELKRCSDIIQKDIDEVDRCRALMKETQTC